MPLHFGELPSASPRPRPAKWAAEVAELRARPGEWALLAITDSANQAGNLAISIRSGRAKAFRPSGAFEATTCGPDVWARYIGEERS